MAQWMSFLAHTLLREQLPPAGARRSTGVVAEGYQWLLSAEPQLHAPRCAGLLGSQQPLTRVCFSVLKMSNKLREVR